MEIKAKLLILGYGETHEVKEKIKDFNTLRAYAQTLCMLDPNI